MRGWMVAAAVLAAVPAWAEGELPGQAWVATEVGDRALTVEDGVTLDIGADRIAGRSGCNRFTGAATLAALTPGYGTLTVGPVAGTRMACMGAAMEIEAAVLGALERVEAWQIEADGTLVLTGGDQVLLRARQP